MPTATLWSYRRHPPDEGSRGLLDRPRSPLGENDG